MLNGKPRGWETVPTRNQNPASVNNFTSDYEYWCENALMKGEIVRKNRRNGKWTNYYDGSEVDDDQMLLALTEDGRGKVKEKIHP